MSWARRPHCPIALKVTAPPSIMSWASTQHRRCWRSTPKAFTVCTPLRQGREAVGATGSGASVLADPTSESDCWWPLATAFGSRRSIQIPMAVLRGIAGRGQAKCSRPSPRRGPAQPPACAAQQEENSWELEVLQAQLEGERLHCQELQRRWAAERCELQKAAERERQLLTDQLRCAWEKQQAQEEQQLKEWEQRQRATGTRQLLLWKEAELRATKELLQRDCDAALRQARELQQQLAKVLRNPPSSEAAHAQLQDVLSKLRWETDGEQPACIRHLQRQLELERRLFTYYIVGSWADVLRNAMSCSQEKEGALHRHRAEQGSSRPCHEGRSRPGARDSQGRPGAPGQPALSPPGPGTAPHLPCAAGGEEAGAEGTAGPAGGRAAPLPGAAAPLRC
ncbi:RIMS-binding protein 3A-like [Coturnix japonica]|uniref:RIMS-binding protein 3A-like n=1 Tax=Coturnix japonica TaxID=93934 RepID=UPI000777D1A0|nr:RIMS-binding protein 3A-like [Coturnix japonica]